MKGARYTEQDGWCSFFGAMDPISMKWRANSEWLI